MNIEELLFESEFKKEKVIGLFKYNFKIPVHNA